MDIGQIEGGFLMGQGLLTLEKVVFDPTTGKNLSDSVWVSAWRGEGRERLTAVFLNNFWDPNIPQHFID